MENYENENFSSENENIESKNEPDAEATMQWTEPKPEWEAPAEPRQETTSYRGVGAGRKESPYANSPYVMNHPRAEDYRTRSEPNRSAYHYQPQYETPKYEAPRYENPKYEVPRKPKTKKKKSGFWKKALAAAMTVALVVGGCLITATVVNERWEDRTERMEQSFNQQIQDLQSQIDASSPQSTGNSVSGIVVHPGDYYSAGQVYAQNVQSVVLIECTVTSTMYGQTATGTSAGSGFILTEDGYVVTNYHVVEGASAVVVAMHDGTRYDAQVVGYDDTNDVAVLKVEATGLNAVTVGSSTDLIVGDMVVAIGNPLGELTSTLTVGYVSAKERDVSTDGTVINMIQTDAAINSGNSGGPLFNMKGEVVGITTAKYSGSSSSGATIEGIGFAIPIDDVREGIAELQEFGYIKSAYMGVIVQDMDTTTASVYGLPIGAYVVEVEKGGAAHRAGIQAKDIIIGVGDKTIESLTDLTRALRDYEPGDTAKVTVYRSGMEMVLDVVLDERPQDTQSIVDDYQNSQGSQESEMPEGSFEDWYNYFAPYFGFGGNGG